MSVAPRSSMIRGACPGVSAPMAAADGLLIRVRLPGGSITPAALLAVAEVAERFGNGTVELTSRANLQIRGLDERTLVPAAGQLIGAGLADPDPDRDLRRDVVASPLTGHDPRQLVDLSGLTEKVAGLLASAEHLADLPPKFGVVLDDGGRSGVRTVSGDICLGAVPWGTSDVLLQVELGRHLDGARHHGAVTCVPVDQASRVVLAAAALSASEGGRLSELIERYGRSVVVASVTTDVDVSGPGALPPPSGSSAIGVLGHPRTGRVNLGAAPLLGHLSVDMLRCVAGLAAQTPDRLPVRLTPQRGLVLLGIPTTGADAVVARLAEAGLSADPSDPTHLVSACAGLPGCSSSRADTGLAARSLLSGPTPPTGRIHLSGCEKRCGTGIGIGIGTTVLVADGHGAFAFAPLGVTAS